MTTPKSSREVRDQYLQLYAQHGDSAKSLDWGSEESQRTRFQVLCDVVPDLSNLSVLDVGCGLAHLADFIDDRADGVRFTGADLTAKLMGAAQTRRAAAPRHHDHRTHEDTWLMLDVVAASDCHATGYSQLDGEAPAFDVVVASGLLADMDRVQAMKVLRWMLRQARVALAFNVQTWVPEGCGQLWIDPVLLADMAMKLSDRWVIRNDYAPHDATVYVYRDSSEGTWGMPYWSRDST